MSPIDFSGGPNHATAVAEPRIIKTVTVGGGARERSLERALDLACKIVPPMDSVARLVRASATSLCPAHDVSPLVTRYVSAVAAVPPDWHAAYPALAAKRVHVNDMDAFKAMSTMPETNEHISRTLSGEELRCLCSPETPKPTRRLMVDSRVSSGCIVRPAHQIDGIHPDRWTEVRVGVEGQALDPVLGTLWRIWATLDDAERETLTDDIRAVLDTVVGRRRWDTRRGWHSGRIDWPSSLHHGHAAEQVLTQLKKEELANIFRSQLGVAGH